MDFAYDATRALSVAAFFFYGLLCLFAPSMVVEFERYGLARMRVLTGTLEVAGALGLVVGWSHPTLTALASGGLVLLMAAGMATRMRIGDPLAAMLPAAVLLLANLFVVLVAVGRPVA